MKVQDEVTFDGIVYLVSTVRLPPITFNEKECPFETMVFFERYEDPNFEGIAEVHGIEPIDNREDLYSDRYRNELQALAGHVKACNAVRNGVISLANRR